MRPQKINTGRDFKIAYFGGEPIGVPVLEELEKVGILPSLVVCNPDRPVGRKHILTPPPVKVCAEKYHIETFQPESIPIDQLLPRAALGRIANHTWDLFVVVAYGLKLPKWLIDLPKYGTLNLHPSLLPKLRGASPIRSAILQDMSETGVTIMKVDEKMDHGPIVAQEAVSIPENEWPMHGSRLDKLLAQIGGQLLAKTIPKWIAGEITPVGQNHDKATFSKKITKADGELQLDPRNLPTGNEAYKTLLKICAYGGWPGTFFMHEGKRVKITDAELSPEGQLRVLCVIPEGKREMGFQDFLKIVTVD